MTQHWITKLLLGSIGLALLLCTLQSALALTTTYNQTFDSSSDWTGNCASNTTAGTLYVTTNFGTCTSPMLNLTSTTWFQFAYDGYHTANGTTFKGYAVENPTSTDNDHVIMDPFGIGVQRWRNEPGFNQTCSGFNYGQWNRYRWTYNKTSATGANVTFNITNSTASCQWSTLMTVNWSTGRDYVRLATGDLNGGYFAADNMTLTVLDNETPSNYSPVMVNVSITPANIADNQDATGHMNATDPNNDTLNYSCTWSVNNNLIASPTLTDRSQGIEQLTSTISETNYGVGNVLNLTCMATDGVHNTTGMSSVVTVSAAGGPTVTPVIGGGGDTTIVIQQVNASSPLSFGTGLITKFTVLHDYNEQPRVLKTTLHLNKPIRSCTVSNNLTCTISENQTGMTISARVTDYDFLSRTIRGSLSVTSTTDDLATSVVEFKLFNLAAGIGPTTSLEPPSFFQDFPYLLRVDRDGHFAGVRLLALAIFLILISVFLWSRYRRAR